LEDPKRPNHYSPVDGGVDPITYFAQHFGEEAAENFLAANALKYLTRYKRKNGVEDLKKAVHCLEMLIKRIKKNEV